MLQISKIKKLQTFRNTKKVTKYRNFIFLQNTESISSQNIENYPADVLHLYTVIPPIILLSGREASSSSFFVAIGGIIFCSNIPIQHFRSFTVKLITKGIKFCNN